MRLVVLFAAVALIAVRPSSAQGGDTPVSPPGEIKCTCSPCGCIQTPPSPPPPPPPSPPPESPYVQNCPPPPEFILVGAPPPPEFYIIGTPETLYPLDSQYYPSDARRSWSVRLPGFVVWGLIALWQFGWL